MAALLFVTVMGCGDRTEDAIAEVTPTSVRSARRAYDGAPPTIPHPPLGAACTTCHTMQGRAVPTIGFAPANPHLHTDNWVNTHNCKQCHLFINDENLFKESEFAGLAQVVRGGDRMHSLAPPVMPHWEFMRENCVACHSGPAARPEILCTHTERANCRQCHVADAHTDEVIGEEFLPITSLEQ